MMQIDKIIAYEQGDLSVQETIDLFKELLKTGLVWKLQGHYQRTLKHLIENGHIKEGEK